MMPELRSREGHRQSAERDFPIQMMRVVQETCSHQGIYILETVLTNHFLQSIAQ